MKASEINSKSGSPALYVDGKRQVPILFGLSDFPGASATTAYAQKNIANFAQEGIHMVTADVKLCHGWHKDDEFEWDSIAAEINAVREADPDTGVLLRFHVNPPYWWLRDNPDECVKYRDFEVIDNGEQTRLILHDADHHLRASVASEKWLTEAGEKLRIFCENMWDTPLGDSVLGIQVAYGLFGEWSNFGPDRSAPMIRRFRKFLKDKYKTDEALQKAWSNPYVTLETAQFVPEAEQHADDGVFRHPIKSRDIMDSQLCISMTIPEAIIHFCDIAKKSWKRPVLVGAFNGYYINVSGQNRAISGQMLPQMLYARNDCVNFLCGPMPYLQNRMPESVPMQRAPLESHRLRDMLWLTEMDVHPAGTYDFVGGDPDRIDESIGQLRRNVLLSLLKGQGMWYYDHRLVPVPEESMKYEWQRKIYAPVGAKNPYLSSLYTKKGWWERPEFLDEIGKLQKLCEKYTLDKYIPGSDVLIIYNPDVHFHMSRVIDAEVEVQQAVGRTGVAYDCIYLRELEICDIDRYKVIVFANSYHLTPSQREMVRKKTKGKQVVWLYGAGFSNDSTLGEDNIKDITSVNVCRTKKTYRSYTTASGIEVEFPPQYMDFNPMFAVDDSTARPIAKYTGSDEIAGAVKGNNWYFGVPLFDAENALDIMKSAGAHIYCDSKDPIIAGNGLVAINTFEGGEREMHFKNGKVVKCTLKPFETAIFDATTGERLM